MSIANDLMKQDTIWKEAMFHFWCENGLYPNIQDPNHYQDVREIYLTFYDLALAEEKGAKQ